MLGIPQQSVCSTALDDASTLHDEAVADLPDDGQIVGDEHIRDPRRFANVGEQVQNLGLDGHVE
jgi:hypothetical protein